MMTDARAPANKAIRLALAAIIALLPVAAVSDPAPQVTLAIPGSGDPRSGTVERFTLGFSEAMVALGDPRAAAPAKSDCPVAATGRWIDQQTYVFEFASALPGGVSCQIGLRDGLASARGVSIGGTRSFTIDTGGPSARAVLAGDYSEIEEGQVFLVAANVAPDLRSISAYGYCAVEGIGEKIALDVLPAATTETILTGLGEESWYRRNFMGDAGLPEALPAAKADRAKALSRVVAVKCRRPLPPGKDMALVWDSRIADAHGKAAGRDQRFDFTVREAFAARFECPRVNQRAGCDPVQQPHVRFTAPIARASALAVRMTLADGTVRTAKLSDDDRSAAEISDVFFDAPLPELTEATITLPQGIKDASGRTLENAARFPLRVKFDRMPPLVKFAAPFGILEAKEGGVLPVTVRAVEPALARTVTAISGASMRIGNMQNADRDIAEWLRKLDDAEDSDYRDEPDGKGGTHTVNYTGTKSLLADKGSAMKLDLPGKGKQFEVVGIPLDKPGFYVVELASPALGQALLGRKATRYVSAGALVTNMAVHFKWGRNGSLAWVTALDSGAPVGGANVRITDSCTGEEYAEGRTDGQGRLVVKSGLPEPETYGSCNGTVHPLMISARTGDDMSFTLTGWGEGIRPYDFDLPYGWSAREDIIHTIFDRTLVRQGETVNMKQIMRRPIDTGFGYPGAVKGILRLSHRGSDTQFEMPLNIDLNGIGEARWTAPQGAPMGDYDLQFVIGDRTVFSSQSIRVDEYRLPTMRATISGPKQELVRPANVPLSLFVGYLSGGGAPGLPVAVRTAFDTGYSTPSGWDGWSFGGADIKEGMTRLDDNGEAPSRPLPYSQTIPVTLDANGIAQTSVEIGQPVDDEMGLTVEMDYQDANGETLTASRRVALHASALRLGVRTDGWLMRDNDLRLKFVALDLDGKPKAGQRVSLALYSREIITARRRLIGGFYAYDNQEKVTRLGAQCAATTDKQGLAECALKPGVSGEVTVVATTTDAQGNVARAVRSVWLAGKDDWWFGGDNGDRMDLVPEQKTYKAGETAKFQVRMPFRSATALVTVEREGVLSSFVTKLSGTNPVIEVEMPSAYAPNVYVSVMAVRGRIGGFRLWLADLARRWNLPFFSREGASPTALVDLSKPSYRIGIARVQVGWEGHRLAVDVKADKAKYAIRETAQVDVAVHMPDGTPARSAEIAFAAVDEALLQLSPNESWNLLDAMMGERTLDVLTSTAQTQVVGKRHYGRKAVEAGGGGGNDSGVTRSDFRPVLLWKGRVKLDSSGHARVAVPLSDNLSSFRMVAVATSGMELFGTGTTNVRTAQNLTIYPGVPPLVRGGDFYGSTFTLRNGSDKPMTVTARVKLSPAVATGAPLTVTIPAGGAAPVTWNLRVPDGVGQLQWTVEARAADGKTSDRVVTSQTIAPAVPTEVWAASLVRAGPGVSLPIAPPVGALPGGYVDVKLSDGLAPPLSGVRAYMLAYPYNCIEQRTSRAIALGDAGMWNGIAGSLPTYLDRDGLLRYFPNDQLGGSPELTAYILSATAAAGYGVPEAPKGRMIEAMKAVVEGRLARDADGPSDNRVLKIAALGALARNGASTPALVGSIDMVPADMPTGTLAEWMTIIDRTPGLGNAAALRSAAEQVLRRRLVYEGTRLDLADRDNAPWWMMVSSDEMAIRALDAVLGRKGWESDVPKMMVGVASRQMRGHWDTTPANAWGAIVARRFASLYPASAIAGTTSVSLGSATRTMRWPAPADAKPLRLPLVRGTLALSHPDSAGPWATVSVSAAVPLRQPLFAGYRISKVVSFLSRKNKDRITRGDVIKVSITVDASAERNWVVVSDPVVPGGTILGGLGGQSGMFGDATSGGEGVQPSYVERGQDAWRGYFAWVPAGRFTVEYAVRLNSPGRFGLPPTRVEAMYAPEIRAQLPNGRVNVAAR